MIINWIGLLCGLVTISGIWLGHVVVRKIEAWSPTLWLPTLITLLLGHFLVISAMSNSNPIMSAPLGILGTIVLWNGLEFKRQERRVKRGHAPANPHNPRHARILAENTSATTINWLAHQPRGVPFAQAELAEISKEN